MERQTLTTAKQEAAIAREELQHWTEVAETHPEWRSPHVHIRGIKAYLKWLAAQPQDKPSIYANTRLKYWTGKP